MNSSAAFASELATRVIRPAKPHKARSISLPGVGRIILTTDPGGAGIFAREQFVTNLSAIHRDGDGVVRGEHDLGSGIVTNVGMMALTNDPFWAAPGGGSLATLALQKWHASGTGSTAEKAYEFKMQTAAGPTATKAVSGTQVYEPSATTKKQIYKTVATLNYTGTEAVTEWGLFSLEELKTAEKESKESSAISLTGEATPFTASTTEIRGEQQKVAFALKSEEVWGLITKSSTSVLTIPFWVKKAAEEVGVTPEAKAKYSILPVCLDHKVFSALNVINGDSIQFTFSLTCESGG